MRCSFHLPFLTLYLHPPIGLKKCVLQGVCFIHLRVPWTQPTVVPSQCPVMTQMNTVVQRRPGTSRFYSTFLMQNASLCFSITLQVKQGRLYSAFSEEKSSLQDVKWLGQDHQSARWTAENQILLTHSKSIINTYWGDKEEKRKNQQKEETQGWFGSNSSAIVWPSAHDNLAVPMLRDWINDCFYSRR